MMSSTVAPMSPSPSGRGGQQVAEPRHEADARQAEQQDRADRDDQRAQELVVLAVLVVHRHEARDGAVHAERGDALAHGDDRQRVGEDAEIRLGQMADDQDLGREVRQDGDAAPRPAAATSRAAPSWSPCRRPTARPRRAGGARGRPAGRRPERGRRRRHQPATAAATAGDRDARVRRELAGTARREVAGLIAKDGSEGPGGSSPRRGRVLPVPWSSRLAGRNGRRRPEVGPQEHQPQTRT